jgi:saccharopine dehydrogenase-like NADP-dependent oxidoreductase
MSASPSCAWRRGELLLVQLHRARDAGAGQAFREAGLVSVNEVGLDPGIDHLMAHDLVARYRASKAYHNDNVLSFTSYCGGVPKMANAFRYKFSWAPAGC